MAKGFKDKLEAAEAKGRELGRKARAGAEAVIGSAPVMIAGAAAGGMAAAAADAMDVGGFEAGPVQIQAGLWAGVLAAYIGRKNPLIRSVGLGAVGYGSGMLYHDWMGSLPAGPAAAAAPSVP